MTANSVLLFLDNVQKGNVNAQGGRAWIVRLKRMAYEVTRQAKNFKNEAKDLLLVMLFEISMFSHDRAKK